MLCTIRQIGWITVWIKLALVIAVFAAVIGLIVSFSAY